MQYLAPEVWEWPDQKSNETRVLCRQPAYKK